MLFRRLDDGMTVHHASAEIVRRFQELVADPKQIFGLLLGKRDARLDAGVNEQIAAFGVREFQAAQETDMCRRDLVG